MKAAVIIALLAVLPSIMEACLINCNGVTPATCTAPCYQCGACRQSCCQSIFGRSQDADRIFRIPCQTGRSEMSSRMEIDPGDNLIGKCNVLCFNNKNC